jgi:hypothetical protein
MRMNRTMRIRSLVTNDSVLAVAVVTDPVSCFPDVDKAMMDADRLVDPVSGMASGCQKMMWS